MPKKLTQKKKSVLPSQTSTTPEGLPVYDTVLGKMIGIVLEEQNHCIVLGYAGVLNVRYEPAENGKKATALAAILNPTFVGEKYYLMRAGIRGFAYVSYKWLTDLHTSYITQVKSGKYELNLCTPPVEAKVEVNAELGDQETECVVALVSADETKAIPNA